MMELRWVITNYQNPKLQYRQRVDTTIRAGMWSNDQIQKTANWQMSEWIDVPSVDEHQHIPRESQSTLVSKCPRCTVELTGSMGYVCPVPNCPSGLGSSIA